jgi:tetratricopeptide (TPR) repeat protein
VFQQLRTYVFALTVSLWGALPAPAQDSPAAKLLGQTANAGSLPMWSKPAEGDRQKLGRAAREAAGRVFLVGHPKVGLGSAWLISKEHRLLATNAHVADLYHAAGGKMFAIPSGSADLYEIRRVWYHPGVRRFLKDADLSVRSADPREGSVDPASPDLAVLQLAPGGAGLAAAWPMATPDELAHLFAQPAAIVGFPSHDTLGWPALGEGAAATYHDGVISRITDFRLSASAPADELQFVQYTMATWPGFSGSPVFLPSGHVVATHNMARSVKGRNGEVRSLPHGIRVDSLWELLAFHGLTDKVGARLEVGSLRVDRWRRPDARDEKIRSDVARAAALIADALRLMDVDEHHKEAVARCNEAIGLVPSYARAYHARMAAFSSYFFENRFSLPREDALKVLEYARQDAVQYARLAPSDPLTVILVGSVLNNIGYVARDLSCHRKALTLMNELLTSDNLTKHTRACALCQVGSAHENLGDRDLALKYYNEAIKLCPTEPSLWENRAAFWRGRRPELEQRDSAKARALRRGPTAR